MKQDNPEWATAGIVPVPGRHLGQTWKELVEAASQLQHWKPVKPLGTAPMYEIQTSNYNKLNQLERVRDMWNTGKY